VAFSINLILIRGFNAFEDTKTQVVSIFIINLVSVGLSYFFLYFLENQWVTVGLGVAFSISYLVGLWVTLALLKKHIGKLALREFAGQHLRLFVAAFLVMLPLFAIVEYLSWSGIELTPVQRAGELLLVMIVAFLGFIFASKAVGVQEISMIRHLGSSIRRRKASQE
jgi:putative peptidoglycan lipid II flippase